MSNLNDLKNNLTNNSLPIISNEQTSDNNIEAEAVKDDKQTNIKTNTEENTSNKITIKSFKKREKNLQEINIDLKYDQDEEQTSTNQKYISVKRKQKINPEYQDIDFLCQSQYRFTLHPFSNCALNNTPNFTFNDICFVKYYTNDKYYCPICLESKLLVPIITRCGHIYCWTCLSAFYQYHSQNEKRKTKFPNCPLCKENLDKSNNQDPKFCEIIESRHYSSTVVEEQQYTSSLEKEVKPTNNLNSTINENKSKNENSEVIKNEENSNENYDDDYSQMIKLPTNSKNCDDKINLTNNNYDYERTNSYNYNNLLKNTEITFNLAFRTNFMIYNVNKDQNLSKFYKYYSNVSIPDSTTNQANFSSLFKISSENLIRMYEKNLLDLENGLQEELASCKFSEEKRVDAFITCIADLKAVIEKFKLTLNKDSNKKELVINTPSKNKDADKRFKYFYQENNGDIYFLHPINYLILINEFKSVERLPTEIKVRIKILY